MKPKLKATGTKRLKLHDEALSSSGFRFNLRRYTKAAELGAAVVTEVLPLGEAVQVDPMKPKSNPLGTKRLKLKSDRLLSDFGFKFELRRYTWDSFSTPRSATSDTWRGCRHLGFRLRV
jgi:hypothetical protein